MGKITADALFNINNYFNDSTTKNKIKLARFHRRSLGSVDRAKLLNRYRCHFLPHKIGLPAICKRGSNSYGCRQNITLVVRSLLPVDYEGQHSGSLLFLVYVNSIPKLD